MWARQKVARTTKTLCFQRLSQKAQRSLVKCISRRWPAGWRGRLANGSFVGASFSRDEIKIDVDENKGNVKHRPADRQRETVRLITVSHDKWVSIVALLSASWAAAGGRLVCFARLFSITSKRRESRLLAGALFSLFIDLSDSFSNGGRLVPAGPWRRALLFLCARVVAVFSFLFGLPFFFLGIGNPAARFRITDAAFRCRLAARSFRGRSSAASDKKREKNETAARESHWQAAART